MHLEDNIAGSNGKADISVIKTDLRCSVKQLKAHVFIKTLPVEACAIKSFKVKNH